MEALRCVKCKKMLAKKFDGYINIKCPRCKHVQTVHKTKR
ncbi:Com family DNA-binding transcriptional regulator [Rappaport israeli]